MLESHIRGQLGEAAASKFLGVPYIEQLWGFSKPDIGVDIGVRCRRLWEYQLCVKPPDPDRFEGGHRSKFLLVSQQPGEQLVIRGWYYGDEAKQHAEWFGSQGDWPPYWFVPDEELWDPEYLREP